MENKFENVKAYLELKTQIQQLNDREEYATHKAREDLDDLFKKYKELSKMISDAFLNKERNYDGNEDAYKKVAILIGIISQSLKLKKTEYFPLKFPERIEYGERKGEMKDFMIYIKGEKIYTKEDYNSKKTNYTYWGLHKIIKNKSVFLEQVLPLCNDETKQKLDLFFKFQERGEDTTIILTKKFPQKKTIKILEGYNEKVEKGDVYGLELSTSSLRFLADETDNGNGSQIGLLEETHNLNASNIALFYGCAEELDVFFDEVKKTIQKDYAEGLKLCEDYEIMVLPYQMARAL